jgi:fatty acid-binding protein DegV
MFRILYINLDFLITGILNNVFRLQNTLKNKNETIQYISPSSLVIWQRNVDYYSKWRQKNNNSRDEIHEKLEQITKQMHKMLRS